MEDNEKFQKINPGYLLLNFLAPIAVLILGMTISMFLPDTAGLLVCVVAVIAAVLWWTILSRKYYDRIKAKTLAGLEQSGFTPNHTFDAEGCTMAVDLGHGKIAFLFRWNPTRAYTRPASALSNVRVDDGCHGAGFMAGSSRVSFLFTIDGSTMRVNTFTSNRRWKMNSEYITTGVQKAEAMVEALIAAGAKS